MGRFCDFLGSHRARLCKFRFEVICSFGPFVLCTLGHSLRPLWSIYDLGPIHRGWLAERRTFYAISNRRVLLLQEGRKPKRRFIFLESLPEISREGTTIGTLWLGPKLPAFGGRRSQLRGMSRFYVGDSVPILADIVDADQVERLILDLREKSRTAFVQHS